MEVSATKDAAAAMWLADEATIRLTPSVSDNCWHMSYKWRYGPWAGHYVYVRVPPHEFEYGLIMLYMKAKEVWLGTRKPTLDRNQNYS